MGIKVGINGFGRIGRMVFRTCMENPNIEVTALNDPAINVDYITYLIKFDSTHGKFKGSVINNQTEVIVNGITIKVFSEELPESIPWESAEVRYVVEASGMFTSYDKASGHLHSQSVRRVIVAAPSADLPMIVLGVNHRRMTSDMTVVSGASSTLYCLAPIIKVLDDNFGLSEGFVTSIHAMTPSLKPLDGLCMRGRHWRDHRSIHQNIIPANTGACKALSNILPRTKDKLAGIAFRVPIVDVSALDITVRLTESTTLQSIIKCVEQASATYLKRIIKTSNEGAVSSDFIGDSFSCILDVESCIQLRPNFYKLICWYENEYSYANRIVNTISLSEETFIRPMHPMKMAKILKPMKTCRGKGDSCGAGSDDLMTSSSSRGMSERGSSPDPASPRFRKKADVFKIWSVVSSAKPSQSAPVKQNKAKFLNNLVPVIGTPAVAQLSPECLQKLHRDFSKPTNKIELELMDTLLYGKLLPRSPERSDADVKFKVNKLTNDPQRTGKQRKNGNPMTRDKCDSIQMAAVLRDIPIDPKTSSSHCLDTNIAKESNVHKEKGHNTGNVSSDDNAILTKYETNHKMPIAGKSVVSHKNCIKKHHNIVTEIETHPIRSMSSTQRLDQLLPDSKAEDTASQSNVMDDTFAKTIDLFVDGLTHGRIFQHLTDETVTKEPKPQPGEESPSQPCRHQKALVERICDMAELVRFVKIPRKEGKRGMRIVECGRRDQPDLNAQVELRTIYNESETASINLEEGAGRRTTLIIDMQQQCEGPETERDGRSDYEETLSEVEPACRQNDRRDIYDKVESASVTDSDNSFYVRERKSEVIQLTDLTRGTSLDDLVKLDKICRIMEISDELSDKLFSVLPQAEAASMRAKWSFKDLCEKIKFDEFCGAVFDN